MNHPLQAAMIPTSEPQQITEQQAQGHQGYASAQVLPNGEIVTKVQASTQKATTADMHTGAALFTRMGTPTGTMEGLTPDTVVSAPSIPGDGCTIAQALAAGFIVQTAPGQYAAPDGSQQAAPDGSQQAATDFTEAPEDGKDSLGGEAIDPEAEKAFGDLIQGTAANDQISAVKQMIESPTGEMSPELSGHMATAMGIEPEALAGQVETVRAGFEAQAKATVEAMGLDADKVFDYAREHNPELSQKVVNDHVMGRSTDGYKALGQDYLTNLDTIDPGALLDPEGPLKAHLANGWGVRRQDRSGEIILTDPNGATYEWKSAVRTGVVSVG